MRKSGIRKTVNPEKVHPFWEKNYNVIFGFIQYLIPI